MIFGFFNLGIAPNSKGSNTKSGKTAKKHMNNVFVG